MSMAITMISRASYDEHGDHDDTKPGVGIRPLLVGSIWRRCAARLIVDYLREPAHKYFTTTYPNFMQCVGGHPDGAKMPLTKRAGRLLSMSSGERPRVHMTLAGCLPVTPYQPLTGCGPSWDISRLCAPPRALIALPIIMGTRIMFLAQQAVKGHLMRCKISA